MAQLLNSMLGLCGGLLPGAGEEKHELKPKQDADAPTPKAMFSALTSSIGAKVLSLAGREAPDPDFDAAVKLLSEGGMFKLVVPGGQAEMASFATSADGTMLTWKSIELKSNMPKFSGVVALTSVTRIERPVMSAVGSWLSGAQGAQIIIHHSTPSEHVKLELTNEQVRNEWAAALDRVSTKLRAAHTEHKAGRKLAHHAQKEFELMGKRQEAEQRKADIRASMKGGGMKHTAVAMSHR